MLLVFSLMWVWWGLFLVVEVRVVEKLVGIVMVKLIEFVCRVLVVFFFDICC